MAPTVSSIEIARSREEVFSYVTDPSTFAEWQAGVVGGSIEGGKCPSVGSEFTTTRRIGGSAREVTSEITKLNPPTSWAVHGVDGPIRAIVQVTSILSTEPYGRGAIGIEFEGHGLGELLVTLVVRRQTRTEVPQNARRP